MGYPGDHSAGKGAISARGLAWAIVGLGQGLGPGLGLGLGLSWRSQRGEGAISAWEGGSDLSADGVGAGNALYLQ